MYAEIGPSVGDIDPRTADLTTALLAEDVRDLIKGQTVTLGGTPDRDGEEHRLSPVVTAAGNVLAVDVVRRDGTVLRTARITVDLL